MLAHSYNSGLSELDRVKQENELLQKKLSKAISKRNYYAKLYYSCMLERDKAKAEREGALKELQRVLIQLQQHDQAVSPTSDYLSDTSRLLSDSSSGSNPTATSLNPSRSISLASLLSLYPSNNLHSPVEDSGLCTGGSTSSLATNKSSIEKESLNSSPADLDTPAPATHTFEGTLSCPLLHSTLVSVLPSECKKTQGRSGPDVTNLLAECAEALEGIADLGIGSNSTAESTQNKNGETNKQKSTQNIVKKSHMISPILATTTSSRPKRAVNRSVKKDENKFVDTFEMESVVWPRSQRDNGSTHPGNMDTIPTSLLQEYAEDVSSPPWVGTLHQPMVKPPELHSIPKKYTRVPMCKLDRIEEMSCESSVSDHSSDQKAMEQHIQQQMSADSFAEATYERKDSTQTNKSKLSYRNLSTYEFRQILFELSTSPDSVSHLEFFRSSFEDEWVLLLLCDEVRRNISLHTLYLVECNLYMATDNLLQLLTAVSYSRLTYLSLARNGLTDRIVESFEVTELFSLHMSLKVLDLSENFLSVGAKNILNSISATCKCEILLHAQYSFPPRSTLQYQLLLTANGFPEASMTNGFLQS